MENIDLIRKIAWSFQRTTGLEWDDLFQEAAVAYLEAERKYDPARHTKFTTFAYIKMRSALLNYLKRERQYRDPVCSFEDIKYDRPVIYTPIIDCLPDDAIAVAERILSCPRKFCVMTLGEIAPRMVRVTRRNGWSSARVIQAIHDIRIAFTVM